MPLAAGNAVRSFLHESRPPAEAPIPTTGKSALHDGGARAATLTRSGRLSDMAAAFPKWPPADGQEIQRYHSFNKIAIHRLH
nr:hypothetical protein [uncultured Rhodopila sp.]